MRLQLFRFQVVAVVVLALAIGAIVLAEFGSTDSAWAVVNADKEIDDRVSIDEDLGVYLVRKDSRIIAFSNKGPYHEELVVYCPSSQLFETPRSGSKFDIKGLFFTGPSARGLTRYRVRMQGDEVQINIVEPIPGPSRARSEGRVRMPVGPYCIPY